MNGAPSPASSMPSPGGRALRERKEPAQGPGPLSWLFLNSPGVSRPDDVVGAGVGSSSGRKSETEGRGSRVSVSVYGFGRPRAQRSLQKSGVTEGASLVLFLILEPMPG